MSPDASEKKALIRYRMKRAYAALQESSKHQGVLALFDQYFIKPKILPKEMGKILHHAFDTRQIGDYEEEAELTKEQAFQVLDSATKFVQTIEQKLSEQL